MISGILRLLLSENNDMKNPKHQTPKTFRSGAREAATSNKQPKAIRYLLGSEGSNIGAGLLLKDEATPNPESNGRLDLEERTAWFGEAIVRFSKKIPRGPANDGLISQVVGAGTSVGANYGEAVERVSAKDFKAAIGRCKKGAKETMFFLRMIAAAEPSLAQEAGVLYREAKELMLIFASIK
jgi:four helix bundle protein